MFTKLLYANEGNLELGEVGTEAIAELGKKSAYALPGTILFFIVLGLGVAFIAYLLLRREEEFSIPFTLTQVPNSAKALITFLIVALGLVHFFAMVTVYLHINVLYSSVEEYFFYMKPAELTAISHGHLFGHALMYTIVGGLFLLTKVKEKLKILVISIVFSGGILDVFSWWMIKYVSSRFEVFSMISGGMLVLGFAVMSLFILKEIWFQKINIKLGKSSLFLLLLITLLPYYLINPIYAQDEPIFDFESPELAAPLVKEEGLRVGPVSNINFGGLLDMRYIVPEGSAGGMVIHVDELVITANIGDNISLLAEQLLPTSVLESVVGDDHGFVYATIANLPGLPLGTALRVGRFRLKYGIDATIDAPANPVYPLVRKNLGFISDKALELAGFIGPIDYTIAVADGPDHIESTVYDDKGNPIGRINQEITNDSKPLVVRISGNVFSNFNLGLSHFRGESWQYINGMAGAGKHAFGGMVDRSTIIYKKRTTIDLAYRLWKLDLLAEYNQGEDFLAGKNPKVKGYYLRTDYAILPGQLGLLFQYDFWDDGRTGTNNEDSISMALTWYIIEQAFVRVAYTYNQLKNEDRKNTGVVQLYLPF